MTKKKPNTFICLNCGKENKGNKGTNKFCSNKCQVEYQSKQKVKEWKNAYTIAKNVMLGI